MASARIQKKKQKSNAAARKKAAPAAKKASSAPDKKTTSAAAKAPVAASKPVRPKAEKKPAATKPTKTKADKPAVDPRVADLQRQVDELDAQLSGGTLDLVTKVTATNRKKDLVRRMADLQGDRPFLTKTPKHKQAA